MKGSVSRRQSLLAAMAALFRELHVLRSQEGGGASQSCLQLVMTGRRNVIGIVVVLMPSINHPPQISDLATTIFLPTDNSMPFDPLLRIKE